MLIFFFASFVVALGWLFASVYDSPMIFVIALLIAIFQPLIGYFSGDSIVLASTGAVEIQKKDNPVLWNTVENLAITAGLPMPRVFIIDDSAPNAFATGRDPKHASVAVTTGLLQRLEKVELEGVIAHELSHVGNYDIRLMTIVAILVGVIAVLSDLFIRMRFLGFGRNRDDNNGGGQAQAVLMILALVAAILAPIVSVLIQLAISRRREFMADNDGALLTRYPEGLASALIKISGYKEPMEKSSTATAHLFISNPLGGGEKREEQSFFAKIFSTHPPVEERVRLLRGTKL